MIKKSLISLALGAFAIGMTEFTMMGILPDIAQGLEVSIPSAGHLISLYALGVVIGAPTFVLLTSNKAPKKMLIYLMLCFTLFNGLFAIGDNITFLYITRFMAGLPHGAFFGVASVVAAQLAPRGKAAQAISIMFTGMTVANLAGVPIGTWLGHNFSWQWTYGIIALLGLMTCLAIHFWLPQMPTQDTSNGQNPLSFFKRFEAWHILLMISIGTGGMFAWLSYIAPLMTDIAHLSPAKVPIIMVLVGLGMFVGNLIGGYIADTLHPHKATIFSFGWMTICLLIVFLTAHLAPMAYIMSFVTGMAAFSIGSPIQMILINAAKGTETIAAAAGQAAFNMGNTLGAFLGGIPIAMGMKFNAPELVGMCLSGSGMLLAALLLYQHNQRQQAVMTELTE